MSSSKLTLDNAIRASLDYLTNALAEERARVTATMEKEHKDLAKNLNIELRRGLAAALQPGLSEAPSSFATPSKASDVDIRLMSPAFAGDWPVGGETGACEDIWDGGRGESEEDSWLLRCCRPHRKADRRRGLPLQPACTPPETPKGVFSSFTDHWAPASVKHNTAVRQVSAPPDEETQAESFYRETMESLRDPLVQKRAMSFSTPEMTPLQRRLAAIHFDVVVGIVIVLNMFFIGYSTQYGLQNWKSPANSFITAGEWFFICFFITELGLRLRVEGSWAFLFGANSSWNGFDSFLVGTALFSQVLNLLKLGSGTMRTSTSLRVLRLFKMVRMLRVLKGAQAMHELRSILSSVGSSCRILFWAMILMLFIYFTFGLVFMNAVSAALPNLDDATIEELFHLYGTVARTMLTLFMSTTGGMDWSVAANILWKVGAFYYTVFLFYVSVVSFAIVNLITGLFVDGAMKAAEKDRIVEMQDVKSEADDFKEAVKQLFMEMVLDEDGILDREELAVSMEDTRMKAFMEWMQYDTNEIITLFRILDKAGGSKGVTFDFFVDSCFRFGQKIKGLDLLILLDEQGKVHKQITAVAAQLARMERKGMIA